MLSTDGNRSMAKVQKTFFLNPDLSRVVDAVSEATGASFTKLVTAALIQYLLSDLSKRDPKWMILAINLEKGTMTVSDIAKRLLEEHTLALRDRVSGDARIMLDSLRSVLIDAVDQAEDKTQLIIDSITFPDRMHQQSQGDTKPVKSAAKKPRKKGE